MQKIISLKLLPSEASKRNHNKTIYCSNEAVTSSAVNGYIIIKHLLMQEANNHGLYLTLKAFINEPCQTQRITFFYF